MAGRGGSFFDIFLPKMVERETANRYAYRFSQYLKMAGPGDQPRPTDLKDLEGWWSAYDQACRTFPKRAALSA